MNQVYLKKIQNYDIEAVTEAVDTIFTAFGFYEKVKRTPRVVLKPNLVMRSKPEEAIITHPNVVAAVGICLKRHGASVLVAESGGGLYNPSIMKNVFKGCGYTEMAEAYGLELYTECLSDEVELQRGLRCNRLSVIRPFQQPREHLVVDLAKLKTHGMMAYSGAVKNLFGVVPGLMKPELHCRYPEKEPFAEMLVDLCDYVQPDFSIIDAIDAMEGDGPTGGQRRFVGALLGSDSPYDADLVGTEIINIDPMDILMLRYAHQRGFCGESSRDVTVLGDAIDTVKVQDFKRAKSSSVDFIARVPKFLQPLAKKITTPYPKIRKKACVGCGKCAESCPQHTITISAHKAEIHYDRCIRCFCCHEMCPKHVIDIRRFSLFDL